MVYTQEPFRCSSEDTATQCFTPHLSLSSRRSLFWLIPFKDSRAPRRPSILLRYSLAASPWGGGGGGVQAYTALYSYYMNNSNELSTQDMLTMKGVCSASLTVGFPEVELSPLLLRNWEEELSGPSPSRSLTDCERLSSLSCACT